MWTALFEVLKDLFHFAFAWLRPSSKTVSLPDDSARPKKLQSSLTGVVVPYSKAGQSLGRVAYIGFDKTLCLSHPQLGFDEKVAWLNYGDKVVVSRLKDQYAEVVTTKLRGWVSMESLTEDLHEILPDLESGSVYGVAAEKTRKIRKFLADETLAEQLKLPLQSVEFVLYTLKYMGVSVAWPPVRPRTAGTWQGVLRGIKGVTISIEPRTSAIMEHIKDETAKEFIGYVEAVHPDQSITLKSVGRMNEGEYLVENFTKEEWKEWRPVFISFG